MQAEGLLMLLFVGLPTVGVGGWLLVRMVRKRRARGGLSPGELLRRKWKGKR